MGNKNSCEIKYLSDPPTMGLHYLSDYEYARRNIRHSSFAELQAQVVAHCPPGFECVVPMALFHELVWQMRKDEEDHLRRPIFEVKYNSFLITITLHLLTT